MKKFLPLAGIGCVALLVIVLIVGGAIMLGIGVKGYFDQKEKEKRKKAWIVPTDRPNSVAI